MSENGEGASDVREILLTAVDTVAWFASGVVFANYLWTLCDMYASIHGHPLGKFPIPGPIFFALGIGWLLRRYATVQLNQFMALVALPTAGDMARPDGISIVQQKYRRLFYVVDALAWALIAIECGSFLAWWAAGSPPDFQPSSWSVWLMIQRVLSLPLFFCIGWLGLRQSRRGALKLP